MRRDFPWWFGDRLARPASSFQYTQSVWFDRATNVLVRANVEHRNCVQAPTLVNWAAFDVMRPQTAAR